MYPRSVYRTGQFIISSFICNDLGSISVHRILSGGLLLPCISLVTNFSHFFFVFRLDPFLVGSCTMILSIRNPDLCRLEPMTCKREGLLESQRSVLFPCCVLCARFFSMDYFFPHDTKHSPNIIFTGRATFNGSFEEHVASSDLTFLPDRTRQGNWRE